MEWSQALCIGDVQVHACTAFGSPLSAPCRYGLTGSGYSESLCAVGTCWVKESRHGVAPDKWLDSTFVQQTLYSHFVIGLQAGDNWGCLLHLARVLAG